MFLYRSYGVERSWLGFLKGFIKPTGYEAALKGYLPGMPDGDVATLPADFLIGPDLKIDRAYYGKDIGDHLALQQVVAWAGG